MKVTKSGRRSRAARTPSPDHGRRGAGVARNLSRTLTAALSSAASLVGRMPGTLDATRTGARDAANALQALPDPTLRWLAAGSVGVGAGLFLAGKPRLIIAAGVAPALAMGAAMVARRVEPVVPASIVRVTARGPRAEANGVAWDLTPPQRGARHG
jgi:uncharacterized protein YjeT (DUF2065 family)